jgi:hypothetical protein
MKKLLMVPLLILASPVQALTGLELQQMGHSITDEAAMFQGYVIGVYDSTKSIHKKTACLPIEITNQIVLDTVLDYLDTHVAKLQEPADKLIVKAITNQFPCNKPPPK